MPAEIDLARRIVAGDRDAFESFFERLFVPFAAFASRHASARAAAERIVEESFVELLEALWRPTGSVPLDALALAIVRRRALAPPRSQAVAVRSGERPGRALRTS